MEATLLAIYIHVNDVLNQHTTLLGPTCQCLFAWNHNSSICCLYYLKPAKLLEQQVPTFLFFVYI